jgi:hypothetical protein
LGRFGDTGTPILLPLHPRSAARIEAFGIAMDMEGSAAEVAFMAARSKGGQ